VTDKVEHIYTSVLRNGNASRRPPGAVA
jgi:hypothetical protein